MGLSVMTEPSSPTARATAELRLEGDTAAGSEPPRMSPKLTALVESGSAPPPCSPKREVLTADARDLPGVFPKVRCGWQRHDQRRGLGTCLTC